MKRIKKSGFTMCPHGKSTPNSASMTYDLSEHMVDVRYCKNNYNIKKKCTRWK